MPLDDLLNEWNGGYPEKVLGQDFEGTGSLPVPRTQEADDFGTVDDGFPGCRDFDGPDGEAQDGRQRIQDLGVVQGIGDWTHEDCRATREHPVRAGDGDHPIVKCIGGMLQGCASDEGGGIEQADLIEGLGPFGEVSGIRRHLDFET